MLRLGFQLTLHSGREALLAVSCADLRAIQGLGECAPGLRAVQVQDDSIFDDNPIYGDKPIVDSSARAYTGNLTALPLQTVLVKANSPATLERVRTYLAVHAPPTRRSASSLGWLSATQWQPVTSSATRPRRCCASRRMKAAGKQRSSLQRMNLVGTSGHASRGQGLSQTTADSPRPPRRSASSASGRGTPL